MRLGDDYHEFKKHLAYCSLASLTLVIRERKAVNITRNFFVPILVRVVCLQL